MPWVVITLALAGVGAVASGQRDTGWALGLASLSLAVLVVADVLSELKGRV